MKQAYCVTLSTIILVSPRQAMHNMVCNMLYCPGQVPINTTCDFGLYGYLYTGGINCIEGATLTP